MPTLSTFYGIVIRMYYSDHAPPHFHALYAENEVLIDIGSLAAIGGELPRRALHLTREWARRHQRELQDNWERCRAMQVLKPIAPLP